MIYFSAIRNCDIIGREKCNVFYNNSIPCWEASKKGELCINTDCRECSVYKALEEYPDIKSVIKTVTA